jgi:hypothetical protein
VARRAPKILAILGLAVVYALLKLSSTGVLPCEAPGGDPCPPGDSALDLVPAKALLYAHVTLDRDAQQFDRAGELADRLPHAPALIRSAVAGLGVPSGATVDLRRDVEPWLGDEAALVRLAAGRRARDGVHSFLLIATRDPRRALRFADKVGPGKPRVVKRQHTRLRLYGGGFAASLVRGFLVLGDAGAVREAVDTADPPRPKRLRVPPPSHPPLTTSKLATSLRATLPANRFADVYLSRAGVERFLAGAGGYATQLDTFADYGATRGIAAAAVTHHDGVEVRLVSALQPKLLKRHPSFFGALAPFEPTLAGEVSENALVYAGVGKLGAGLQALLAQARRTSPALAASLRDYERRLSARARLGIARRVLPLLGGEGALAVEPAARVPYVNVVVDGVHEKGAGRAIAKLARPLVAATGARRRSDVAAGFTHRKIEGVEATTIRLSPSVNLTFAVFDGKLVVGSDPAGLAQVRSGTKNLSGSDEYKRVTRYAGDRVSALVFLNLEALLALAERAGLTANPAYATFRADVHRLKALGVGVSSEKDRLSTRFFLSIR